MSRHTESVHPGVCVLKEMVIEAPVAGSVWSHSCDIGQKVHAGSQVLIMECMKTEIPVETHVDGEVRWLAPTGIMVNQGDPVARIG